MQMLLSFLAVSLRNLSNISVLKNDRKWKYDFWNVSLKSIQQTKGGFNWHDNLQTLTYISHRIVVFHQREEEKRKERIEDWERHQRGGGYRSKYKPQVRESYFN